MICPPFWKLSPKFMMRSADKQISRLTPLFFLTIVFSSLAAPLALQAQEQTDAQAATEEADETAEPGESSVFDVPIPVGQTSTGVVIQDLDEQGIETSLLKALKAIRISEEKVEFEGLELLLTNPGEDPITIIIERGVYDSRSRVLYSRTDVTIKREDFTLWGEALEYNTATREGKIIGKNRMTIHDISDYMPQGDAEEEDDAAGDQSARATESSRTQTRLLSEL